MDTKEMKEKEIEEMIVRGLERSLTQMMYNFPSSSLHYIARTIMFEMGITQKESKENVKVK